MSEIISAPHSRKVNDLIFSLKSSSGLPFRALLPPEHLKNAMEKVPAFRDRVFPP